MIPHGHKWQLRDDGKYECDCGVVKTKRELAYRTCMTALSWRNQTMIRQGQLKIDVEDGSLEVEGTPDELLQIYYQLMKEKKA